MGGLMAVGDEADACSRVPSRKQSIHDVPEEAMRPTPVPQVCNRPQVQGSLNLSR